LEFKGKDILLIGSSYSAEDIGSQCFKYGARSITSSYRNRPMGYDWPDNWSEVPMLSRVEGRTAYFMDGSSKDIDAIILCTGYKHHFPFMEDSLRLSTDNRLWPSGLYKGIFWEGNPKLVYLGMQDQYYTFNMFDAQAWYARDVILGRIQLPSYDEMAASSREWREREEGLKDPHDHIVFQGDYVKDLLVSTDYPYLDVDAVNEAFFKWKHDKQNGIMTYRDISFRSIVTGSESPVHHTKWLEALDDSLECFLNEA
jgi:trimethylamine monooxygenase